jgi:RNA polymerase sigma factor (TIGR02999 family)
VTELLEGFRRGDREAESRLINVVYGELHRMAGQFIRAERPGITLQASALVNEAYLRLVGQRERNWQNRNHFLGVAGEIMRRILVESARRRAALKRGGGLHAVELQENLVVSADSPESILALDEVLTRLAGRDPRQARVVELRFFAGLEEEQIAELLGVSLRTVKRDWRTAKAWLHAEMGQGPRTGQGIAVRDA